ncbi:MAG TPA: histidine kinase dimerization/phospho-acceptor domain-containing protein, partial [Rhodothermales bacterium]|nr:histidine kinase dimerization/phospho-acceptor domain-containing protein [Rhodothermales bacterium]
MTRYEQKSPPALAFAIVATIVGVFLADLYTPLGVAVWVLYLIPVALSLFSWRPTVPLLIAGIVTALMAATFFTDAPGVDIRVARINRVFGVLTVWTVAAIGYQYVRSKVAVRRQEWLQAARTGLSERIAGDPRLDRLGNDVLRFLAEYLDAQAGVFYAEHDEDFERVAGYAVPAGAAVPERFASGEGLLGQAAADKRAFVVHDVPEGYLAVGSALGSATPRHLLVAPMVADGRVQAVIEFGFLHDAHDADTELMAAIAESVAVAVRSARDRERLQALLEETQAQSEELQAQSEELRVSNEELEEQGRALRESAARLELQQAELEQTNVQLEEQTQLLESQRDEVAHARDAIAVQAHDLAQASRYKSDFLANMSHELRTPLNSSLILAKLLIENRGGNLTDEQVNYARTIASAGNDLLTLINDILDLSKIEAGHMEVQVGEVVTAALVDGLARAFQPVADQKGLALQMRVAGDAPARLQTDGRRLEQVLKNL